MPGGRTFIRKSRRSFRRRGAKAIAVKALREVNKIKSNIESKFKTTAMTVASVVAGTPSVTQLTDIDVGDTVNNREGNMASLQSINIRGVFTLDNPTGTVENEIVRVIIFIDKEGEVVRTDLDEVLDLQTTINGLRDPIHMGDFRVLLDKTMTFQNLSLATDSSLKPFSYFKRFKRAIKCKWISGTGTAPEANQIYMAIQVSTTVGANTLAYIGRVIVKFTDL